MDNVGTISGPGAARHRVTKDSINSMLFRGEVMRATSWETASQLFEAIKAADASPTWKACACLAFHRQLESQIGGNPIVRLWNRLFGGKHLHNLVKDVEAYASKQAQTLPQQDQQKGILFENFDDARLFFIGRFNFNFGTSYSWMSSSEAKLMDMLTQRIWNSEQVQGQPANMRYWHFEKLLAELYIGSHMLFELDASEKSLLESLRNQTHQPTDDHGIEERTSTHYGKVSMVDNLQYHIRGHQNPEAVFQEAKFAADAEGKIIPGVYADKVAAEAKRSEHRVFWIQTENTPDGPDWASWTKHRTWDFLRYIALKKIAILGKTQRPQIARYKSLYVGRGVPDSAPIHIKPAAKSGAGD